MAPGQILTTVSDRFGVSQRRLGLQVTELTIIDRRLHNAQRYSAFPKKPSKGRNNTMLRRCEVVTVVMAATLIALTTLGASQEQTKRKFGYKDTPMLPGGQWHVHDGDRPLPPVIDPGTASIQETPGKAPSDAVVLFDGRDLSRWQSDRGGPAGWDVKDEALVIHPGAGALISRDEFSDCQLQLEFASPVPAVGHDQGRGNSGVMFFSRYEIQVLDSYDNLTYADGQAAAIYGQYPPLVNASRKPGDWQSYDIVFTAP